MLQNPRAEAASKVPEKGGKETWALFFLSQLHSFLWVPCPPSGTSQTRDPRFKRFPGGRLGCLSPNFKFQGSLMVPHIFTWNKQLYINSSAIFSTMEEEGESRQNMCIPVSSKLS